MVHVHNAHIRVDLPGDYWLELAADQAWAMFLALHLQTHAVLKMPGYDRIEIAQLTTRPLMLVRYIVLGESIADVRLEEPDIDALLVAFQRLFRALILGISNSTE